MIQDYHFAFGAASMNTTCLADIPPPDFEGSTADAKQIAKEYFGTTDLWNANEQTEILSSQGSRMVGET